MQSIARSIRIVFVCLTLLVVGVGCGASAGDPSNQDLPTAAERRAAEKKAQKKAEEKARLQEEQDVESSADVSEDSNGTSPEDGSGLLEVTTTKGEVEVDFNPKKGVITNPTTFTVPVGGKFRFTVWSLEDDSGLVMVDGYKNQGAESEIDMEYEGGTPSTLYLSPYKPGKHDIRTSAGETWGTLIITK